MNLSKFKNYEHKKIVIDFAGGAITTSGPVTCFCKVGRNHKELINKVKGVSFSGYIKGYIDLEK